MRRLDCEEGKERGKGKKGGEKVERINKLKKIWERKERVEGRRNVVVKGFKGRGGEEDVGKKIKEIFDQIVVEAKIKEVR